MRANVSSFLGAGLLSTGMFVAMATRGGAQSADLPFVAGSLQGGPVLMENQQQLNSNPQLLMGLTLSANICRNVFVETQLSRMALKKTGNADVKRFAEGTIAEDREFSTHIDLSEATQQDERFGRWEVSLPVSENGLLCARLVPSETWQAVKQMKKLSGTKFDRMYLVQMDAYVKNDGEVAGRASAMAGVPAINDMGMRAQSMAEEREARIARLTAEENFRIQ